MIDILLSTYNGEVFLREQIDSIINQTYTKWQLLIRDDGSTDNTVSIIYTYKKKYNNIIIINDDLGNLGSTLSFAQLIKYSKKYNLIIFCVYYFIANLFFYFSHNFWVFFKVLFRSFSALPNFTSIVVEPSTSFTDNFVSHSKI